MADFDNQAILNAILGTGAVAPQTTLNTGIMGGTSNQQQMGGQLPNMQGPLEQNPTYMSTVQNIFGGQQPFAGANNFPQSRVSHAVGRDSWSSGIGLDHGSILNNIGLGNRQ